jgi:hypothetical protein
MAGGLLVLLLLTARLGYLVFKIHDPLADTSTKGPAAQQRNDRNQ